jgi:HlyD family secretion protein
MTIATLGLPVAVYSAQTQQQQQQAAAVAAEVQSLIFHTVARGDVDLTISAVGAIDVDQVANLSFTNQGRVVEILVEQGQVVRSGDPLIRLDSRNAQIAYDRAELAVQNAQLALQDVLDGPDEGNIRIAEANVASAWAAYNAIDDAVSSDQIQAAQLRVEQAQRAYEDANRARRVAGGDNEQAITILDAQIGEASFNLEIARQQLSQLQNSNGPQLSAAAARANAAEAELERVRAGATDTQVRSAEVSVEQAMTDRDQAAQELAKYTLTASFDGVVSRVDVEIGSLVSPGLPVVQLVDIDPLRVKVDVDEIDIRRISPGMGATVSIDALNNVELPAAIDRIALVGTNNGGIVTYPVEVALSNTDSRVRPGMTSEAEVVVDSRDDVLVVPNEFVRLERRLNRAFVNLVQPDGSLREIEIELGLQGTDTSEVLSGLQAGDVIAANTSGQSLSSFFGG